MTITDLEGENSVGREDELLYRLRSIRKGNYGAFILSHQSGPSLWVHINRNFAYLHYFPHVRDRHPGFQPAASSAPLSVAPVHFLTTSGDEASSIDIPGEIVVAVDQAYEAAAEFMRNPEPPASIDWLEL